MDMLLYIAAGAGIGVCIGLTGVGGGSLMTPLLLLFGYPLPVAIGTDLLYAACTKGGGMWVHSRQGTVNWRLCALLAAGSLPMAILTIVLLGTYFDAAADYTPILTRILGVMLLLTALVVLFRRQLQLRMQQVTDADHWLARHTDFVTVVMGAVLGVCVTLSSVGAGAFAAAILMVLYARLPVLQIVGTDIAHAVPLTLIAGLGHLSLGNVDFYLLLGLLVGSLPAVAIGTKMANHIPDGLLRPMLAGILFFLGLRFILL